MNLTAKIITRPPDAETIEKNIRFGTAVGLTKTVKDGQAAVLSALPVKFTLRGSWFAQSNKFGIKVKSATKDDLSAEVRTNADWLIKQQKGGEYFPFRNFLAIPTSNVRRNKRQIIPRAQRPKNLKNAFVMKTKSGLNVLFQRKGRGKNRGLVAMYILEPKIRIKPVDAFNDPIDKVVRANLSKNIEAGIQMALSTIKSK